jgi:hypothetical protein
MSERLECGCKRGKNLCNTAEMLWSMHSALDKAGCPTLSRYFRNEYDLHFTDPTRTLEAVLKETPNDD